MCSQNTEPPSLRESVKNLADRQADEATLRILSENEAFHQLTYQEAMAVGQFRKAISGDTKAASFILELLGDQDPLDREFLLELRVTSDPSPGGDPP